MTSSVESLLYCRYSSYGRHFTKIDQLRIVAKKLEVFINPGDTIVDFSCGYNQFLPLLKRHCLQFGKAVSGRAFDIITPCINEDFRQISWFNVEHGGILLNMIERFVLNIVELLKHGGISVHKRQPTDASPPPTYQ